MRIGRNVNIHPTVQVFGSDAIEIGDNVRIDAFCVLSGGKGLKIGSHIHIACGNYFFGGGGMVLEDFVEIAPQGVFMSQSDDFSGESLIGPCVPSKFKPGLKYAPVRLGRHVVTGVRCTVLPGVTLGEGVALAAGTVATRDCEPWWLYGGIPAKKLKERSRKMLELEQQFLKEWENDVLRIDQPVRKVSASF